MVESPIVMSEIARPGMAQAMMWGLSVSKRSGGHLLRSKR